MKRGRPLSLSDVGERALLGRILSRLPRRAPASLKVVAANGDDCFAAKLSSTAPLLVTTDTLLEGTHFNLKSYRAFFKEQGIWRALGRKAMAVNLSDLAAMGEARPLCAFVTLGLSGDISVETVDNLYTGMSYFCSKFGFIIAGGDIIRSDKSMLSVTILGCSARGSKPLTRGGAREGNILMSTGPLGLSAAGLKILKKQEKCAGEGEKLLLAAHVYPQPRLEAGRLLASGDIMATSCIDASDDLFTSLHILAEKSRVGFEIDLAKIPIHPALAAYAAKLRRSPLPFLLYGGEDYELLFTVRPEKVERVMKKIPSAQILGRATPRRQGIRLLLNGKPFHPRDERFRHF